MTGFLHQTLPQIFEQIPIKPLTALPEIIITGISLDSRTIQAGQLYVAIQGGKVDGHNYIPQAVEKGAVAVLGSRDDVECPVPYIQVDETRLAMAHLAAAFYGFPAQHLTVIGVTGTDGKTTTASLVYHILIQAGYRTGIISTINATIGQTVVDTGFHVTTPESPEIQRYLARMVAAGLTHVVLEATSHGLAQDRVAACDFDVAAVTNITHEHLDYHGSYEAYWQAKARLFTGLAGTRSKSHGNPRAAVLNLDDISYGYLAPLIPGRKITYSIQSSGADVYADAIEHSPAGLTFVARGPGFSIPVQSSMVGLFNASNCLAAIGASVVALELPPETAQKGIAAFPGVPGRMERIDMGQEFSAIVDFAHTPNALKVALETVRRVAQQEKHPGRVIAVFGSAGLRDAMKRRMMAEVSAVYADLTILTAEDPRTEALDAILEEMASGMEARHAVEGQTFWRIPDRGDAIRFAVQQAHPGDVVIACGKGHEQSMAFGDHEYPWDDRIAMRAALAERLNVDGPSMPYLPTQASS